MVTANSRARAPQTGELTPGQLQEHRIRTVERFWIASNGSVDLNLILRNSGRVARLGDTIHGIGPPRTELTVGGLPGRRYGLIDQHMPFSTGLTKTGRIRHISSLPTRDSRYVRAEPYDVNATLTAITNRIYIS